MERRPNPESSLSHGRVRHTETGEVFDIFDPAFERVEDALPLGKYEHFKSTPDSPRYYQVDIVVRNVETGESFVVYRPLYPSDQTLPSARPLSMFTETIEHEGKVSPRFSYVG